MRLAGSVRRSWAPLALAFLACPTRLPSQEPASLDVEAVVTAVRAANPALRAARLRSDAALERVPQSGALPDPTLSLGLMNRPVDDLGSDQAMTMNSLQWAQRFPWPGKRGLARERSSYAAEADALAAADLEATLIARAKGVYYGVGRVDRAVTVMESTRTLLRDFLEVTTARYAVGSGIQQDILQAQVAVAQTTADLAVLAEHRTAMVARLNALMGRPISELIGAVHLPEPGPALPPVEDLLARAAEWRPAIRSAQQRVREAEAAVRVADRQRFPDLTVTVGYGHRPRFDDMATLMLGMSLPLWSGSKQEPLRREMQTMRSMEQAREDEVYTETFARITELRARADRARTLSGLYSSSVLPQANAAVESALSAYRVGRVDYMTLLSNQMTVNRYEIELLEMAADYHSAVAEIEALTGSFTGGEE